MRKQLLGLAFAFGALVAVSPALAGDDFRALNHVKAVQLSDSELAKVEGAQIQACVACFNLALVTQSNIGAAVGGTVQQYNGAYVKQNLIQSQMVF